MNSTYNFNTRVSWQATVSDLQESFRLWGVRDWHVKRGMDERGHYTKAVTLHFNLRGRDVVYEYDRLANAESNLRALYLGIESMRMNEKRGIADVVGEMYLQLEAPKGPRKRDPYEVLQVRPDSSPEIIDAAYKALAKKLHPDNGGSNDAFVELQEAYDRLKAVPA